jgi:hypothetical protein
MGLEISITWANGLSIKENIGGLNFLAKRFGVKSLENPRKIGAGVRQRKSLGYYRRRIRMFKLNCIKKKPEVVESPIPDLNEDGYIVPCIGLVVGHNERAQGANNYLGESEWRFNSRIAKKVQNRLNEIGIRSVIVFRPKSGGYKHECASVARELKGKLATHAVLMHFNSAGVESARGVEVLISPTASPADDRFADIFSDMLNESYGFRERGDDGKKVVGPRHNGSGMLQACLNKGVIACLIEPCFADYRTEESKIIFENEDAYVNVLTVSIHKAWATKK